MKLKINNHFLLLVSEEDKLIRKIKEQLFKLFCFELKTEVIIRTDRNHVRNGLKSKEIRDIANDLIFSFFNHIIIIPEKDIYIEKFGDGFVVSVGDKNIFIRVQFANWALLYKDFFTFAHDKDYFMFNEIIYFVPDNDFSKALSSGTVNYNKTKSTIIKYENVFKNNITIIGLNLSYE